MNDDVIADRIDEMWVLPSCVFGDTYVIPLANVPNLFAIVQLC
jgi:hypothetical protein